MIDVILICFRWVGFKKGNIKNHGHAFGQFLDGFCGFDMILILF